MAQVNYQPYRAAVMPIMIGIPASRPAIQSTAEQASGAIAGYMHQNGIDCLDPNQLYALANNKGGNVPPEVQKAAAFMLSNPEVYRQIETSDVAGADGKSGVWNFDKAAQGNIPFGSQGPRSGEVWASSAQEYGADTSEGAEKAAGALGAYMHAHGMRGLDVNTLYALATNKGGNVPAEVQEAAGFMLKHPDVYKQIETADKAGADGKSGVWNFDKAAQGLLPLSSGPAAGSAPKDGVMSAEDLMAQVMELLGLTPASRGSGAGSGAIAGGGASTNERAEKAAGALGAYMHAHGMRGLDVNTLYGLANNKGGKVPQDVQDAARFMLSHPKIYEKIETADKAGADGKSGVWNFDKAAQGLIPMTNDPAAGNAPNRSAPPADDIMAQVLQILGLSPTSKGAGAGGSTNERGEKAAGALGAYMHAHGMRSLDVNTLYALANNKGGNVPKEVQDAAGFMLKHPGVYKKIETSDVAGADGKSGVWNFDKAAQGLVLGR